MELFEENLGHFEEESVELIRSRGAIVALGGTGRGELAPYSDVDLLFLQQNSAKAEFQAFAGCVVRTCWDAGLEPGQSVRRSQANANEGISPTPLKQSGVKITRQ